MPASPPTPRSTRSVPDKPTVDGLEDRWAEVWESEGTYRFDRLPPGAYQMTFELAGFRTVERLSLYRDHWALLAVK